MGQGLRMLEQNHGQSSALVEICGHGMPPVQGVVPVGKLRSILELCCAGAGVEAKWGLSQTAFGELAVSLDDLTDPSLASSLDDGSRHEVSGRGIMIDDWGPDGGDPGARENLFENLRCGLVALAKVECMRKPRLSPEAYAEWDCFAQAAQEAASMIEMAGRRVNFGSEAFGMAGLNSEKLAFFRSARESQCLSDFLDSHSASAPARPSGRI